MEAEITIKSGVYVSGSVILSPFAYNLLSENGKLYIVERRDE